MNTVRFLVLALAACAAPAAQVTIPEPRLTNEQRAWVDSFLPAPALEMLRGGVLPALGRGTEHFANPAEAVRFETLLDRALLEALWFEDQDVALVAVEGIAPRAGSLLHRDARRSARAILAAIPHEPGILQRIEVNGLLDGDTLAEALDAMPPFPIPLGWSVGALHRSLRPSHLPRLLELGRGPLPALAPGEVRHEPPLDAQTVLEHAGLPWLRLAGRWLIEEGHLGVGMADAEGDGLSPELAAILRDPRLGNAPVRESWIVAWLMLERAGPRDVEVGRALWERGEGRIGYVSHRELATRIFADAGHRPLLTRALHDPDEELHCLALAGLAKLGDAEALSRVESPQAREALDWLPLAEADPARCARLWVAAVARRTPSDWLAVEISWPRMDSIHDARLRVDPERLGRCLAEEAVAQALDLEGLLALARQWPEARTSALVERVFSLLESIDTSAALPFGPAPRDDGQTEEDLDEIDLPAWAWPDGTGLDVCEVADAPRLKRLLRTWLQSPHRGLRAIAASGLLRMGDPRSGAALVEVVEGAWCRGEDPVVGYSTFAWPPWLDLVASDCPAVREFLRRAARERLADPGDEPLFSEWDELGAALLGVHGLSITDALDWTGSEAFRAYVAEHPEYVHRLVETDDALELYLSWLEGLPEDVWFHDLLPPTFSHPRVTAELQRRYREGLGVTRCDLARFDPALWEREIDDRIAAGWYGFLDRFGSRETRLYRDPERLVRLVELTESNCCMHPNLAGDVCRLLPEALEIDHDRWSPGSRVARARILRLLPRMRWSRILDRYAVAPR